MVEFSGFQIERMHVCANGRTAYDDTFGVAVRGEMLPLAETVLFRLAASASGKMPGGRKRQKADMRFECGVWWGKSFETNEHVLGTLAGATTARVIRWLPEGKCADKELLLAVKGVPWNREYEKPRGRPRAATPIILQPAPAAGPEMEDAGIEAKPETEDKCVQQGVFAASLRVGKESVFGKRPVESEVGDPVLKGPRIDLASVAASSAGAAPAGPAGQQLAGPPVQEEMEVGAINEVV
jgi:hypothetical protein